MLTLNDGRSELWQWDTGRTLSVDADCSQVHFSNKVFGRSIDVDVIDGAAIIPDVLLQTDKDLNVWAFVGTAENGYTKISKTFKVNRRNKPADYVFTPPDQTTLAELSGRLDRIEESQDPDAIKNAVNDYLEQNPVESPVQSVNGKTGAVGLNAEDVGAIAKTELPTAINTALAQAKASGEFDGPQGPKGDTGATGAQGPAGATGPAGTDGKSAYQYAQDGGYTGTEAEFAAKLASGALIVTLTDSTDSSSDWLADKSYNDIRDAIFAGIQVYVFNGEQYLSLAVVTDVSLFFGTAMGVNDETGVGVFTTLIEITNDDKVKNAGNYVEIPSTLPNPNALTFTGAVTGSYDGSAPLEVNIPQGGGGAWHTIGTQKMDGVETAVSFDLNGETIIQIIVTASWGTALTATKATVILTFESGETVQFTPQTMNATAYAPKNIFTIFGNSKHCRQMIFSKSEGAAYNNVHGSFGAAYWYSSNSEYMVEDGIATGITITFEQAPSNAAIVKVEGM